MELKIEEFLASFGEKLNALTEEAFNTQVCVCVCIIVFVWASYGYGKVEKVTVSDTYPKSFRNVKSCSWSYFGGLITHFLTVSDPAIQAEEEQHVETFCAACVCVFCTGHCIGEAEGVWGHTPRGGGGQELGWGGYAAVCVWQAQQRGENNTHTYTHTSAAK